MKRATRQRLVLLLVVAALLLLAGWQLRRDENNAPGDLTTLDPAAITRITLSLPGAPTLHYARRDGHWWRTDGTPARAIDNRLDTLTRIASAPVSGWRPASDFDAAKIGLSSPQAVLTLDDQTLAFGATSVTGPQHYVRVGQRIALVSARYMPTSPAIQTTELH